MAAAVDRLPDRGAQAGVALVGRQRPPQLDDRDRIDDARLYRDLSPR